MRKRILSAAALLGLVGAVGLGLTGAAPSMSSAKVDDPLGGIRNSQQLADGEPSEAIWELSDEIDEELGKIKGGE